MGDELRQSVSSRWSSSVRSNSQQYRVAFDAVHIRCFERIIGDHPSCSAGAPITIGWEYDPEDLYFTVNEYETVHSRSSNGRFALSKEERHALLVEWGFSSSVIAATVRKTLQVKRQRRRTVNNNQSGYDRWEAALEKGSRKLKKIFGTSSKGSSNCSVSSRSSCRNESSSSDFSISSSADPSFSWMPSTPSSVKSAVKSFRSPRTPATPVDNQRRPPSKPSRQISPTPPRKASIGSSTAAATLSTTASDFLPSKPARTPSATAAPSQPRRQTSPTGPSQAAGTVRMFKRQLPTRKKSPARTSSATSNDDAQLELSPLSMSSPKQSSKPKSGGVWAATSHIYKNATQPLRLPRRGGGGGGGSPVKSPFSVASTPKVSMLRNVIGGKGASHKASNNTLPTLRLDDGSSMGFTAGGNNKCLVQSMPRISLIADDSSLGKASFLNDDDDAAFDPSYHDDDDESSISSCSELSDDEQSDVWGDVSSEQMRLPAWSDVNHDPVRVPTLPVHKEEASSHHRLSGSSRETMSSTGTSGGWMSRSQVSSPSPAFRVH